MGKKSIRRLESKGNMSQKDKSKLTNSEESNKSHCRRNFEKKATKAKAKKKAYDFVFHFSQSGLPYSHLKRIPNHCSYSR